MINSSVWRQADHTRLVWLTLLSMCDKQGFVNSSVPGLADLARVRIVLVEEALAWLGAPDPYWYNQEWFGRKIEPYPGGWVVLDYQSLRKRKSEDELREVNQLRQAKWRKTHKQPKKEVSDEG